MIKIEKTISDIQIPGNGEDEICIRLDQKTLFDAGFRPGEHMIVRLREGRIEIAPSREIQPLEKLAESYIQPISYFDNGYKGYRVNMRLERQYDLEPRYISQAYQVYDFLKGLEHEPHEKVLSVMLDTSNKVVGVYEASKGGVDRAMLSPYEVFQPAYLANSKRIILAHNHPSGDSNPSTQDHDITSRIKKAAEVNGMQLLDHVIIGDGNYTSFTEKGYL